MNVDVDQKASVYSFWDSWDKEHKQGAVARLTNMITDDDARRPGSFLVFAFKTVKGLLAYLRDPDAPTCCEIITFVYRDLDAMERDPATPAKFLQFARESPPQGQESLLLIISGYEDPDEKGTANIYAKVTFETPAPQELV